MRAVAAFILLSSAAWAAGTQAWEMTTWQDFLRGRFSSVSLTRDGRLQLGPKSSVLFGDGQSVVWSAVEAPDGSIYFGTGHRGRVFKLDASGRSTEIWAAPEPEVFALAVDAKGVLYAATSPDGKVYRIENGRATEYFDPKSKYIWSLAVASNGTVYAGTGDQGRVFSITGPGRGEVYYDTGQVHVTALAFDAKGELLAGSDPNGILYRISAKDKAFVIYDANLPEIRAIVPSPDGRIYVAALGGSVAKRASAASMNVSSGSNLTVIGPGTSITVTDAQAGLDLKPKPDAKTQTSVQSVVTASPATVEITGVEKSAIYRIQPDGTVESLWSSKEENAYDVLPSTGGDLVFSTDGAGRVYRLSPDRRVTLVEQTNEGDAVRLLAARSGIIAATMNQGKLLLLAEGLASGGSYESPVHDAGAISRWGRLDWHAGGTGGAIVFRTRSGNSARPDRTWSDWSSSIDTPGNAGSPTARYVQWKAEFRGAGLNSPVLDSVSLAYLPQNNPPAVKSITVTTQLAPVSAVGRTTQTPANATYTITVTDTGESGASTLSGTTTQNAGRAAMRQMVISWIAEDPEGDQLVYRLAFRGEGEQQWKTMRPNLSETSFAIDGDLLADGRYFFRVVASDRPGNPPEFARESDLVSAPILMDNTPPIVRFGAPQRSGTAFEVTVDASDATSSLRRFEYSVNAGPWVLAEAVDGVTDSPAEQFRVRVDPLMPGEHLLTVRVTDAAGNPGLGKLVIQN